jgi:hypothetical protein
MSGLHYGCAALPWAVHFVQPGAVTSRHEGVGDGNEKFSGDDFTIGRHDGASTGTGLRRPRLSIFSCPKYPSAGSGSRFVPNSQSPSDDKSCLVCDARSVRELAAAMGRHRCKQGTLSVTTTAANEYCCSPRRGPIVVGSSPCINDRPRWYKFQRALMHSSPSHAKVSEDRCGD